MLWQLCASQATVFFARGCSQAARAAQALSAAQSEARAAGAECAELRTSLDRALRDKRSAAAEMEQLKARAVHLVPGRVEDVSKHAAQVRSDVMGTSFLGPSITFARDSGGQDAGYFGG